MDFVAHYRRACELAADADDNYADSIAPCTTDEAREESLCRAGVLGQMAAARAKLAWVAYMGVDAIASQRLAEDAANTPEREGRGNVMRIEWPPGGAS